MKKILLILSIFILSGCSFKPLEKGAKQLITYSSHTDKSTELVEQIHAPKIDKVIEQSSKDVEEDGEVNVIGKKKVKREKKEVLDKTNKDDESNNKSSYAIVDTIVNALSACFKFLRKLIH